MILLELFWQFFTLAFVAFGGASALLPELHRTVVEQHHWLSSETFTQLFAIAQAAPGPNVLVVTLIGWEVAGVAGAIAATLGMCLPMSVAIYLLFGRWEQFKEARWRKAIQMGVAPMAVGLIVSSGTLIGKAAGFNFWVAGLMLGAAYFSTQSKLHPLWLIAAGALVGALCL